MDFAALARQLAQVLSSRIEWLRAEADPQWARVMSLFAIRPTEAELEVVLRECFFASLLADEQRATRLVMSLLPDPPSNSDASSGFIRFAEAQTFSRTTLRALAPAAPPKHSLLCVQRGQDDRLVITGMHTFARHYGRPIALSFAVTEPGTLTVSSNNVRLMSVTHGEVTTLDGFPFDEAALVTALAMHQHEHEGDVLRLRIVGATLMRAARAIREAGHGGSIWICRKSSHPTWNTRAIAGTDNLFDVINRIEARERAAETSAEVMPSVREGAAEQLLRDDEEETVSRTIAQLAATDGAVLMTMEPRLVGYSTFIHADPPDTVFDTNNGRGEARPSVELGGGRHRAAAAFCGAGEPGERAAIVVSQDGGVSLFVNVSRPIPPALWHLPHGVARIRLAPVGRGFAFI